MSDVVPVLFKGGSGELFLDIFSCERTLMLAFERIEVLCTYICTSTPERETKEKNEFSSFSTHWFLQVTLHEVGGGVLEREVT